MRHTLRHPLRHLPTAVLAACTLAFAALAAPAAAQTARPAGATTAAALGFSVGNMDRSVGPRQDFYRFAVGNWLRNTDIPASEGDVGGFTQLGARLDAQLLGIIQAAVAAPPQPAGSPGQQVADYWRAAMDLARQDAAGLRPLQADLDRIAALPASPSPAALGELSARLQLGFAASPLANFFVVPDARDSSMNQLMLLGGVLSLTQDQYARPEEQRVRDLYTAHIARMFQAAGQDAAAAAEAARTVLSIETELAAAQLTPLQMRDPSLTYNIMSLAQAQALIPAVDLAASMRALGVAVPPTFRVHSIEALKAAQRVLTGRPPEALRTWLRWHVLTSRASALGQPWRGLDQAFNRDVKGLASAPSREREIVSAMGAQLYHPLSQLYVQQHFPERTRQEIDAMVGHIRAEFERRLRENPWLDEPTRQAALAKLARIDVQVGYPRQWIDFSGVAIRPDDHFGNTQRLDEFGQRRQLAQAGRPVVRERFADARFTTPISVNAGYSQPFNSIDITAAIVQPPFYVAGADAAVNYCTIGAVIGHELTHGFDSMGRLYDAQGNLRDWWTPRAAAEFKKRTDVLVRQYGAFTLLPGVRLDGALTLTENTADLGGITLAHAALRRHLASAPQGLIDGMNADQRCFVAWAQMWAYKGRPERIRLLAATDPHANATLRGFAPLLHLDAFHQAFGTQPGDPMWRAPKDRVRIW